MLTFGIVNCHSRNVTRNDIIVHIEENANDLVILKSKIFKQMWVNVLSSWVGEVLHVSGFRIHA